jgi:hypothetical protein
MERLNIVVLGLDETNRELLGRVPDADRYEFHGLLTIEEMQLGDDIPVADLLHKAESTRPSGSTNGTTPRPSRTRRSATPCWTACRPWCGWRSSAASNYTRGPLDCPTSTRRPGR